MYLHFCLDWTNLSNYHFARKPIALLRVCVLTLQLWV